VKRSSSRSSAAASPMLLATTTSTARPPQMGLALQTASGNGEPARADMTACAGKHLFAAAPAAVPGLDDQQASRTAKPALSHGELKQQSRPSRRPRLPTRACDSAALLLLPGRPGALLRPAPLRTGRAAFTASGSSKPVRSVGVTPYDPLSYGSSSSSGPFAATVVAASNLSVGTGVIAYLLFTGSPDHVSTLSGPGTRPVSGRLSKGDQLEGLAIGAPGFPLPFSCRRSLLGHPVPAKELGVPHGRLTGPSGPDPDGVTAFRTNEIRPGWVPPIPRGRRCSSRPRRVLGQRLPLRSGQSLDPAPTLHLAGLRLTRHQRGFSKRRDKPVRRRR
jgi:hypothetical protein